MSSSYRNRFSSYAETTAENGSSYDNYLAKKTSAVNSNVASVSAAKALATSHLTGEFIKGAGVEGAVRLLKPSLKSGLDYLDRGGVKGGARMSSWVDRKMGMGKFQPRAGKGVDGAKPSGVEGVEAEDLPTVRKGGDYSIKEEYDPAYGDSVEPEGNGATDVANSTPGRGVARPTTSNTGGETKGDDTEGMEMGDNPTATSAARKVRSARPENDGLGAEEATEGAEDVGMDAGEEAGVGALETAGTALDATGVGAVIGVPLQLAGMVLEGGAIYEAGKSIVDWFENDVLGNKAKINPTLQKIPQGFSTLTSSGLGATPTQDTTMDAPSGGGSW